MSVIADLIRAGVDPDLVARVADEIAEARAAGARDANPVRTARQERNARYYQSHKRLEASEASDSVLIQTPKVPQVPPYDNKTLPPSSPSKVKTKRATRLPEGWKPNDDGRRMASEALGNSGARDELAKFSDYWLAKPGSAGCKLDWDATWRNWIRSAIDHAPRARAGPASPSRNPYQSAIKDLLINGFEPHDDETECLELTAEDGSGPDARGP